MSYVILKVFNNNVLLCEDAETKQEIILVGKGIGFGKRPNDTYSDNDAIEKRFTMLEGNVFSGLQELYQNIDGSYFGVATEAIAIIDKQLDVSIPPQKMLSAIDHIVFALQRVKDGMILENPFKNELRIFYAKEWAIATEVISYINENVDVTLPDDEIAFITMHITSIIQQNKPTESSKEARIVNECVVLIEKNLKTTLDRNSLAYMRLVTHLRFVLARVMNDQTIKNPMTEFIKEKLFDSFRVASEVANYLKKRYRTVIVEDEMAFIALHISRLRDI